MGKAVTINVKIVGHELKEEKEKLLGGGVHVYDMLHVRMKGVGGDKTRITLVVDPDQRDRFPLGDKGEVGFEIRQQRLPIDQILDKVVDEVNSGAIGPNVTASR